MISVGPHKADILSKLITISKPKTTVELGGYLGYSAILFADAMKRVNGSSEGIHVWSLEFSADFAAIARKLVDIAGLSELVTVVVGAAEDSLKKLKQEGKVVAIDFLFLDHVEKLYVTDFQVVEKLGFLHDDAVVVADNVVKPGAPEYRKMMREHRGFKSRGMRALIQPGDLEVSVA